MLKTNKSLSKRLKVTKNGKIKSRKAGRGHFNAKMSRKKKMAQKRDQDFKMTSKNQGRFLPYSK